MTVQLTGWSSVRSAEKPKVLPLSTSCSERGMPNAGGEKLVMFDFERLGTVEGVAGAATLSPASQNHIVVSAGRDVGTSG